MRRGCLSVGPSIGIALLNNDNLVAFKANAFIMRCRFLLNKNGAIRYLEWVAGDGFKDGKSR